MQQHQMIALSLMALTIFSSVPPPRSFGTQTTATRPAQSGSNGDTWAQAYGGPAYEEGRAAVQTFDGGTLGVGQLTSFTPRGIWAIRLDSKGNMLWQKSYGGAWATSVQQTQDGGFILAGLSNSGPGSSSDSWLLKLDSLGNVVWGKAYNGSAITSIIQTPDGGFAVSGSTNLFDVGYSDAMIIRLDSNGNVLWSRTYGASGIAEDMVETSDGGFAITGESQSFNPGGWWNTWVIRLDALGNTVWAKVYGGTYQSRSIQQTLDGGFIVVGITEISSVESLILRLDPQGNMEWQRVYENSFAVSVATLSDGGFAVVGSTFLHSGNGADVMLLRLDDLGNIVWARDYGGPSNDFGSSVGVTSEGGFMVSGSTWSFAPGAEGFWILKLDKNGLLGTSCLDFMTTLSLAVTSVPITIASISPAVTSPVLMVSSKTVIGVNSTASATNSCQMIVFAASSTFDGNQVSTNGKLTFDPLTSTISGSVSVYGGQRCIEICFNLNAAAKIYNVTSLSMVDLSNGSALVRFGLTLVLTPYALSSDVTVTIIGGAAQVSVLVTRTLAVDGKDHVDIMDLLTTALSYGSTSDPLSYGSMSGPLSWLRRYNPKADINADGVVDMADVAVLVQYFGAPIFR